MQYIIDFFSFWILLSYLVPISLFVTLEIVRGVQGFVFINSDPTMVDPDTGEGAKARNVSLNESLGKVTHIFADKTGTLTRNEMQLRLLSIRAQAFGSPETRLETLEGPPVGEAARTCFDPELQAWTAELQSELQLHRCTPWDLLRMHAEEPDHRGAALLRLFLALVAGHELLVESPPEPELEPQEPPKSQEESEILDTPGMLPVAAPPEMAIAAPPAPPANASGMDPDDVEGSGSGSGASGLGLGKVAWWARLKLGRGRRKAQASDAPETPPQEQPPPAAAPPRPIPWLDVPVYTGPSPDEVALVTGCAVLGFVFLGRSAEGIEVDILGHRAFLEVLETLEFSSQRRRASTIVRLPDGAIWILSKGADVTMIERMHAEAEAASSPASPARGVASASPTSPRSPRAGRLQLGAEEAKLDAQAAVQGPVFIATAEHLHRFSTLGLRTLVVGGRRLDPTEYGRWRRDFQAASAALTERLAQREALADTIERGMTLFGVVGVEDKLQEGVPEAIRTFLAAGIKVAVITGDKRETAINIALSCGLFRSLEGIWILEASSVEQARARLRKVIYGDGPASPIQSDLTESGGRTKESESGMMMQLVVDGATLGYVLRDKIATHMFAELCAGADAVVVCRSSPWQKASRQLMYLYDIWAERERELKNISLKLFGLFPSTCFDLSIPSLRCPSCPSPSCKQSGPHFS